VATKLSDRLAELEAAFRAERDARDRLREAMRAQGEILRDLRAGGVASTIIAVRVARILGLPLGVESRKRIAAMLRSRTRRHSFLPRVDGDNESSGVPLAVLAGKEISMPKLLKRTVVTEEFVESAGDSDVEAEEEESDESNETEEDDVDEQDEDAGQRRRPPSDRRRR